MNESEKRRKMLLEQTRERYSDKYAPPAVHPRYRAAYRLIYGGEEEEVNAGSLGIRTFFCLLLFTLFVAMDYKDEEVFHMGSEEIVETISEDLDVKEVWKNL